MAKGEMGMGKEKRAGKSFSQTIQTAQLEDG